MRNGVIRSCCKPCWYTYDTQSNISNRQKTTTESKKRWVHDAIIVSLSIVLQCKIEINNNNNEVNVDLYSALSLYHEKLSSKALGYGTC